MKKGFTPTPIGSSATARDQLVRGFTLIEVMIVVLIFVMLFAAVFTVLVQSDRSWRAGSDKIDEQKEARRAVDEMVKLLRQANSDWIITECNPAPPGGDGLCTEKNHYSVTITEGGKRLDFYRPTFYPDCCDNPDTCPNGVSDCTDGEGIVHGAGEIRLFHVIFRVSPGNPQQLEKKIGLANPVVIANNLEDISFSWGCTCDAACINGALCRNETDCFVTTVSDTCCDIASCNNTCAGCGSCSACYKMEDTGACVPCPVLNINIQTRKANVFNLETRVTLRNRAELPENPTPTVEESQEQ